MDVVGKFIGVGVSQVVVGTLTSFGAACDGFVGKAILPAAAVVGAGSMGTVALACATGAFIVFLPVVALNLAVDKITNPYSHWLLTAAIHVGWVVAHAAVGAVLFGLAINPVICCSLAGAAVFKLVSFLVAFLISLFSGKEPSLKKVEPAPMSNHASYSFLAPRTSFGNRVEVLDDEPTLGARPK